MKALDETNMELNEYKTSAKEKEEKASIKLYQLEKSLQKIEHVHDRKLPRMKELQQLVDRHTAVKKVNYNYLASGAFVCYNME